MTHRVPYLTSDLEQLKSRLDRHVLFELYLTHLTWQD